MTLRNLQVFEAVAECGNMTKAAEKLFVSQPSVSLAISDIEKEYDVVLFERAPGRLKLTATGQVLLNYAKRMLKTEWEMEQYLNGESDNSCVRIGATVTAGSALLGELIAKMKTEMPNVNYHVTVANTGVIERMLLEGEADIALVEGEHKNTNLETRVIMRDKLVLICSRLSQFAERDAIDIHELAGVPLILREPQSGTREHFLNIMRMNNIECVIRWSSYSYGAIIDAVEHDLGVGVISEALARKYEKLGMVHICNMTGGDFSRSFKLTYQKNKLINKVMLEFFRICGDAEYILDH